MLKTITAKSISSGFSLYTKLFPRVGHRVLMYHSVGSKVDRDNKGIFSISPVLFERHVNELSENLKKIRIASFLDNNIDFEKLNISITFDDGYKNNLYIAAPILLKHKISFTVFVTSDFIQRTGDIYMSPSELLELSKMPGASIGAHGKSHKPLTKCDDEELKNELEYSKKYLENIIGKSIDIMSYPHGAVDERVYKAVNDCGYKMAATSIFNINKADADRLLLSRTEIKGFDSENILMQKVYGAWDWLRFKGNNSIHL